MGKNKKQESNGVQSPMTQQPPAMPQMWGQPQQPQQPPMGGMGGPGMFGGQPPMFGMPPQQPPAPAAPPAATKPSQFGGYVPPADGKGGGQVLIKSVNGKVVI